jgi:DNA repair protein RecO (recombination protein O)
MLNTDAIVLAANPYSESSLIVRLLTAEFGVVRVLAKGARRPNSRLHGTLEPLARISAMVGVPDPEKLGNLGETTLLDGWPHLRAELDRLAYAGLGIETIGRLAEASAPDRFHYDEARRLLEGLARERGAGSLTIAFLLRLLQREGFAPQLEPTLRDADPPTFVAYDFEAARFEKPSPTTSAHALRLPRSALEAITEALANPPDLDGAFEVAKGIGPILLRWLIRVWEDHLGTRLKSAAFLEKMILGKQ